MLLLQLIANFSNFCIWSLLIASLVTESFPPQQAEIRTDSLQSNHRQPLFEMPGEELPELSILYLSLFHPVASLSKIVLHPMSLLGSFFLNQILPMQEYSLQTCNS